MRWILAPDIADMITCGNSYLALAKLRRDFQT